MIRLFDPHVHMSARTTDDYQAMARAGVAAVLEPAFWQGHPRSSAGSFEDHFASLVSWEPFRAAQFGIKHVCALALNPREANDRSLAAEVLRLLPLFLEKDNVVAVGEIGYDEITPAEERAFIAQLDLARRAELPVIIHTPHREKKRGVLRSLALIRESGLPQRRVLIDHNTDETLPLVLDTGCWAGHSLYPNTRLDETLMLALIREYGSARILINSAADWGVSDPLKVPKAAAHFLESGLPLDQVRQLVWDNPVAFFSQSGRLDLSDLPEPARRARPRTTVPCA